MNMRYKIIDEIRGITLISMILYHGIWDLVYIFGMRLDWYKTEIGYIWQQSICWTFILLSGFCWSLGRKKLKRGLQVFGASVLISAVTLIAMPDNRVLFGVLSLLGTAMLIMIPLKNPLKKVPPFIGAVVSLALFIFTKNCCYGFVGFGNFKIALPSWLYQNYFTAFLGFPQEGFYSMDYFPLLPCFLPLT